MEGVMTLTTYMELEQRSDEWYEARCGKVTASIAGKLVTPKTNRPANNDATRDLAALLAAERITGYVDPTSVNADMWRGIESERYAVEKYGEHYAEVTSCGFMVRDDWGFSIGYSPDGLVGDDGLIEIKSPRQKGHLTTILDDEVPTETHGADPGGSARLRSRVVRLHLLQRRHAHVPQARTARPRLAGRVRGCRRRVRRERRADGRSLQGRCGWPAHD
jgi:hypothetical protein